MLVQGFGWFAGITVLLGGIPQVVKLLKSHNREGVSSWTYTLWLGFVTFWAVWSISVGAVPGIVDNSLSIPIVATALLLLNPTLREKIFIAAVAISSVLLFFFYSPALAAFASLCQVVMAIPSLRLALIPNEDLSGVAIGTWVLTFLSCVGWLIFDVGIHYPLSGVAGIIPMMASVVIVYKTSMYKRQINSI